MTNLTKPATAGATIPETLHLPPLPEAMAIYLRRREAWQAERDRFRDASPAEREAIFVGAAPPVPALDHAGRAHLAAAERALAPLLAPVSAPSLAAWLAPINARCCNPQGAEDFRIKVAALHDALRDLPGGAFTAEARRRVAGDFFPGPDAIRRAVAPEARRLRLMAAGITSASRDTASGGEAHPSPAEREAQDRRDWSDAARVRLSIEHARGSPLASIHLRMIEKALTRHAPHLLPMLNEPAGVEVA